MSEKISEQFGGLDMSSLIGGPLKATCDAQVMLSKSTADFINNACMTEITPDSNEPDKKVITARTVNFSFKRAVNDKNGDPKMEDVDLNVPPLLAVVEVPALAIDDVDVSFDMEVKSSESSKEIYDKKGDLEANAGLKIGPFHMDVKIKGSISSHKENTRSSDNSAKYYVEVHASQGNLPEGLSRVLDIVNSAIASITRKDSLEDKSDQPKTNDEENKNTNTVNTTDNNNTKTEE